MPTTTVHLDERSDIAQAVRKLDYDYQDGVSPQPALRGLTPDALLYAVPYARARLLSVERTLYRMIEDITGEIEIVRQHRRTFAVVRQAAIEGMGFGTDERLDQQVEREAEDVRGRAIALVGKLTG